MNRRDKIIRIMNIMVEIIFIIEIVMYMVLAYYKPFSGSIGSIMLVFVIYLFFMTPKKKEIDHVKMNQSKPFVQSGRGKWIRRFTAKSGNK